jgi:hypothetical protein
MKKLLIILTILCLTSPANAQIKMQQGYIKKDGTYVQPHIKTKADGNIYNNFSTKGNKNPYNNKAGYKPNTYKMPKLKTPKPLKLKK